MEGHTRRIASTGLAAGVGLLLMAAIAGLMVQVVRRPTRSLPKVIIGANDEIYYSHAATRSDAIQLGSTLRKLGYFSDRGATVLFSRNPGGSVVSFVLKNGLWNSAAAVTSFEEVGRRIAGAAVGFPVEIRLVDSAWKIQRTMQVGKVRLGARDEVYYLGSATAADAQALGQALISAGYLKDLGVSVSVAKDPATAIGFVVGEGVWTQQAAVAGFEQLARKVAPSVGGLPVQVRLLSPQMEIKTEAEIR